MRRSSQHGCTRLSTFDENLQQPPVGKVPKALWERAPAQPYAGGVMGGCGDGLEHGAGHAVLPGAAVGGEQPELAPWRLSPADASVSCRDWLPQP